MSLYLFLTVLLNLVFNNDVYNCILNLVFYNILYIEPSILQCLVY